jgi:hypothetical protein
MLKRQKKTCEHRIEVTSKVKFYYVGWHKVLEKIGKGEFGDVMLGIYQVRSQLLLGGNTKGGSITVPLTSCLTGLELAV